MLNYGRIRINKDSIIKVPTRTGGTGEGDLYLFFKDEFDPDELPLVVGGEIAEALRAWISGSKVYPVTENGILNIFGAIVEGLTAERALGKWPIESDIFTDKQDGPYPAQPANVTNPYPKPTSPVPQINVEAIARGVKNRK